jgi:hypothetical protein
MVSGRAQRVQRNGRIDRSSRDPNEGLGATLNFDVVSPAAGTEKVGYR